jgi:large subunit ribosomal protein L12
MESVYAALVLHEASKTVDEKSITKVLEAAGVTVDKNQVKALVAGLSEKDIGALIASASAAPVAAAPAAAAPAAKKGKKAKKKKEEKPKEEEPAGLGALFG